MGPVWQCPLSSPNISVFFFFFFLCVCVCVCVCVCFLFSTSHRHEQIRLQEEAKKQQLHGKRTGGLVIFPTRYPISDDHWSGEPSSAVEVCNESASSYSVLSLAPLGTAQVVKMTFCLLDSEGARSSGKRSLGKTSKKKILLNFFQMQSNTKAARGFTEAGDEI